LEIEMKLPEKQIEDVDLPQMQETFVDSLGLSTFDGNTMRLELRVTRFNPPAPPAPPSARRFPACRLIMTPMLVVDLHNQLNQIIAMMEQQGLVKREGGQPRVVN
jgi:hypothetical protein